MYTREDVKKLMSLAWQTGYFRDREIGYNYDSLLELLKIKESDVAAIFKQFAAGQFKVQKTYLTYELNFILKTVEIYPGAFCLDDAKSLSNDVDIKSICININGCMWDWNKE